MDIAVIGALLVAVGSLIANIGQLINYRQQKVKLIAEANKLNQETEKADAETVDILTKASGQLVINYRQDLDDARKQINDLKLEFEKLGHEVSRLKLENVELREVKEDYDLLMQENEELWKGLIISLGQLGENDIAPKWRPNSAILKKYSEYLPRNNPKQKSR